MTDEQLKFLTTHICNQTTTLAKHYSDLRGDIAVLSKFIVESAPVSDEEKARLYSKLKTMREQESNRLSEFPPPDAEID
jgi:hypothetical protein